MGDKLITFASYKMPHDAEFTKDVLVENGIKAMVVGEMLSGAGMYVTGPKLNNVEVQIFAGDLEKAKQVVDEYHTSLEQQNAEDEL